MFSERHNSALVKYRRALLYSMNIKKSRWFRGFKYLCQKNNGSRENDAVTRKLFSCEWTKIFSFNVESLAGSVHNTGVAVFSQLFAASFFTWKLSLCSLYIFSMFPQKSAERHFNAFQSFHVPGSWRRNDPFCERPRLFDNWHSSLMWTRMLFAGNYGDV